MLVYRILAPLVLLAIGSVAACNGDSTTNPSGGGTGTGPSMSAQVGMLSTGDGYGGMTHAFSPTSVTIQQTGTVTWSNNSGLPHNVTFSATDGAPANVPDQTSGSVTRTFEQAGSFSYQCTNHAGMTGQVVVQQ